MTSVMESGPVRMDVDRHVVTVRSAQVQLPLKEFELLEFLLRNAGRVLTRMQLIDRVWGADYVGDTKTLDVHVKRLRAKVEVDPASPTHIVTVRAWATSSSPSARRRWAGGAGLARSARATGLSEAGCRFLCLARRDRAGRVGDGDRRGRERGVGRAVRA